MKILYFDCFAGASGDMILGALFALGMNKADFLEQISLLKFSDYKIDFKIVDRSGLSAVKADIITPEAHKHQHLSQIIEIIEKSNLVESVKKRAIQIFTALGHAEAKMHNVPLEKVHFHEVGAMDAIIDIVGACIGFEMLGITKFYCSKLHVGSGMVKMTHGTFPVPPPAVSELLRNVPIYSTEITGELVTPTGAAIISTVCHNYGAIPEMKIEAVGYGAGTREYKDFPNVLRLMIGEISESETIDLANKGKQVKHDLIVQNLSLIETNIDDLSGQIAGFVLERAFEKNALDCWFETVQMKKNRPAMKICILCEQKDKQQLIDLLFKETTTFGIRIQEIERQSLPREFIEVETEFGQILMKVARLNGKIIKSASEYEQIREAAIRNNVTFQDVATAAIDAFERLPKN